MTALTLIPAVFHPAYQGTGRETQLINWGIFEPLLRGSYSAPPDFGQPSGEGIAYAWEIAPDLSKITFKIRRGVMFHNGWGELTAHDVAYTFNSAIRDGSVHYRKHVFNVYTDHWEAADDYTAVLYLKEGVPPGANWIMEHSNHGGGSVGIVPKKLFDEKGEEAGLRIEAGTGPYTAVKWLTGDEMRAEVFEDYWRVKPRLKELVVVEMPEISTKMAALETGQIDFADIPTKFAVPLAQKVGGFVQVLGRVRGQLMWFSGNYWADEWTEQPDTVIYPRPGFKPDAQHPWIGNPWAEGCDYDDLVVSNPKPTKPVCTSMENARKVRLAMAMAIDRELLVEEIEFGFGSLLYTFMGAAPGDPWWKDEWAIDFDPVKARELLAEAGYPNGFALTVWVAVGEVAIEPEIGLAVTDMWRSNLGLNVSVERTQYAARRPTLVSRSIDIPFQHSAVQRGDTKEIFAMPQGRSQIPTSGWNAGIELPYIQNTYYQAVKESDTDKLIEIRMNQQDFFSYWRLYAPLTYHAFTWVAGSRVEEWLPHQHEYSDFTDPETVIMKK